MPYEPHALRRSLMHVTADATVCDTRACSRAEGTSHPWRPGRSGHCSRRCLQRSRQVFAKVGVADVNPDVATLIRTVVILVVLTALVGAARELPALARASPRSYVFLVLSGLATGASWWCYFRALSVGDAARVAPLDKLSVVLVALFGVSFLGERLAPLNWLGVLMITAGAWLVSLRA